MQVLRSNGEWSTAFVAEHDAPSGLYKVELYEAGSGVFKEGLGESDFGSTEVQLSLLGSQSRRPFDSSSGDGSSSGTPDSGFELETDSASDDGARDHGRGGWSSDASADGDGSGGDGGGGGGGGGGARAGARRVGPSARGCAVAPV